MDNSKIQPNTLKPNVGESIVITCSSLGDTRWFFTKKKENPTSKPISHNIQFTINSVQYKHGGFYYCYGFPPGFLKHFMAVATVVVFGESLIVEVLNKLCLF